MKYSSFPPDSWENIHLKSRSLFVSLKVLFDFGRFEPGYFLKETGIFVGLSSGFVVNFHLWRLPPSPYLSLDKRFNLC